MSKVQWMSKDLWIIAVGFIAAMHIGKLSATDITDFTITDAHQLGAGRIVDHRYAIGEGFI